MAIQLGSAYGKVNLDASGVAKGAADANRSFGSIENSAKKLGATLQNVGKAMTLAITVPLAMMAKDAVMMASSYEESLNKVNVVFEDNGKVILEWSRDAAKNLGMSQQAALEAAATYGNLFTAQGMGTKAAGDMSTALVQLAADLASFNNASPEEVLLALRSGLSGEIEPLKKYGVALNEAIMKNKAFEMGLGDNIQALTESEKIQVRYAIIMDQTSKAQGDFARTSEGLANQLRILKGHWGDTLKILGANLVPIVEKLLVQLNKWLEWFNNADPKTQDFITKLLLIAFVAGPLLLIFGKLLPLAFGGATKSMNPFSGGIFGMIGTFVKWLGVAAFIIKVLTYFGVSTGTVGTAIVGLQATLAGAGLSVLAFLGQLLLLLAGPALLYWAFKTNFMGISDTAKQLWFIIKFYFAEGWKWLVNAVKSGGTTVMDWFKRMIDRIVASFKNIQWAQIGRNMISGLVNGLLGGLPAVAAAGARVGLAALEALRRAINARSPSKKFEEAGEDSGDGYANGLDTSMKKTEPIIRRNVQSALKVQLDFFSNYFKNLEGMQAQNTKSHQSAMKAQALATQQSLQAQAEAMKKYQAAAAKFWSGRGIPMGTAMSNLSNSASSMSPYMEQMSNANFMEQIVQPGWTPSVQQEQARPLRVEVINQFGSGVTTRQATEMVNRGKDDIYNSLISALGGQ